MSDVIERATNAYCRKLAKHLEWTTARSKDELQNIGMQAAIKVVLEDMQREMPHTADYKGDIPRYARSIGIDMEEEK